MKNVRPIAMKGETEFVGVISASTDARQQSRALARECA
jgi:hypothetical protein